MLYKNGHITYFIIQNHKSLLLNQGASGNALALAFELLLALQVLLELLLLLEHELLLAVLHEVNCYDYKEGQLA